MYRDYIQFDPIGSNSTLKTIGLSPNDKISRDGRIASW